MDPELYNAIINESESFSEKIRDVDLNLQLTSQGNSLLHVAAKSGKKQIVEAILNSQPSLMYKTNSEGNTALHIAASLGHLEMTQLLIDRAKPQGVKVQNELQEVEVHIELKEVEVQNELLIRMVNLEKDTPVHVAVRNGHYEIVDILIREDPGLVLSTNSAGESPLFLAVDRGFFEIALHILKIVPECSHEGRNKMSILHAAAIRTCDWMQFKSIHEKEKVSYASEAFVLLNHTVNMIGADFVRELLNNCPSALLEKDDFGWIPLHHAAHVGNAKVVELFLEIYNQKKNELFSEINHHLACITDKEGMSALHISANEGNVDVMKTLITKCPEICELLDSRGRTALHVAVESGKSGAVKLLLETVAFQDLINKQDKERNTPLHLAAVKGSLELLEMLAQNSKVDKGATNKKGMTVIDIVLSNMQLKQEDTDTGREDMSKLLKMMGFLPSLQQGVTRESQQTEGKDAKENFFFEIKDMLNTNLLLVTIVATVTFAAGIALPGAYNTSIDGLHNLTPKTNKSLQDFLDNNSMAFSCSSALLILHFFWSFVGLFTHQVHQYAPKRFLFLLFGRYPQPSSVLFMIIGALFKLLIMVLTEYALFSMIFAFIAGTSVFFPEDSGFGMHLYNNTVLISFSPLIVMGCGCSVFLILQMTLFAKQQLREVIHKGNNFYKKFFKK